jgi:hypothetical protein
MRANAASIVPFSSRFARASQSGGGSGAAISRQINSRSGWHGGWQLNARRVQRSKAPKFQYALAVRLRARGEVDVLFPEDTSQWNPYDMAAHKLGILYSGQRVNLASITAASPLRLGNQQMLNFVHDLLTKRLERPTIGVIEAEGWRNSRGWNDENYCWTQLANGSLDKYPNELRFDKQRRYERAAPIVNNLLGVIRLRMGDETPQYVNIAVKHAQLIEMVPFFVRPDYQSDEGQQKLCRCVHFLRSSPGFTMGEIARPYPMHLGETLIHDQMVIIGADD